jgi:hypothetical protein
MAKTSSFDIFSRSRAASSSPRASNPTIALPTGRSLESTGTAASPKVDVATERIGSRLVSRATTPRDVTDRCQDLGRVELEPARARALQVILPVAGCEAGAVVAEGDGLHSGRSNVEAENGHGGMASFGLNL